MKNKICMIIGIILMVASFAIVATSYARFTSNVSGYGSITFATWSFTANDESMSFTTDLGNLYPGIDRSFQISLSAIGSELPVTYTVKFNYPNNIPNNLKFYTDVYKKNEINLDGDTLSGVLTAGTKTVITIYYDWPYGSAAEEYVPGTAWFNMTIVGHQEDPSGGV